KVRPMASESLAHSRLHAYDGKCDIYCILHRVKKGIVLHAKVPAIERDAPLHDDLIVPLFYAHRNAHTLSHATHLQIALYHIFHAIFGDSCRRKSDGRVLVNKQKILRTQVLITFSISRIEGGGLDDQTDV